MKKVIKRSYKIRTRKAFQELKKPIIKETTATPIITFILSKDY
jgi:hypothetical protein